MTEIVSTIIAMEKAALNRWGNGDPSGFLEICAPDVVYFDPYLESRINGLEALRQYYESIRGKVHFDRFELINPKVHLVGEIAVLTFNYVSYSGNEADRWNCTEVFQHAGGQWRIVQTHWSYTRVFEHKMAK